MKKHIKKPVAIAFVIGLIPGAIAGAAAVEAETVTETVETVTVPESCLKAIESARALGQSMIEFIDIVEPYPMMVAEALEIGTEMDYVEAERLISKMDGITSEMNTLAERMGNEKFGQRAEECEAVAEGGI